MAGEKPAQNQIRKKRAKVLEAGSDKALVRVFMVPKKGGKYHAIIRIQTDNYINDFYAVFEDGNMPWLSTDYGVKVDVLNYVLLAAAKGVVKVYEEDVYYVKRGELRLFYFAGSNLVYVVKRGAAYEVGPADAAVEYAKDMFAGEELEAVREFAAAIPKNRSFFPFFRCA